MAKRKSYDDKFRASTVIMLESEGYPTVKGALAKVSNRVGVPCSTISRWFKGSSNPPPSNVVNEKRGDILAEIENLRFLLLGQMVHTYEEAPFNHLATAFGILTDKHQLLSGNATDRTEIVTDSPADEIKRRIAGYASRETSSQNTRRLH